ncbi:hypothetical protein WN51_00797 [Melipona quadrifasciata]|uniref:Uncharacterized protein n=1 Tax=Melipona quadrifasciata TaxID=166423 RepID=A0A0M8ZXD7_9HYME|nr:hypothetical protein WN51_00797 [Melipona quadrifasciata]
MENASYSCSNLSSPKRKRKRSTTPDSLYVCSLTSAKTVASLDRCTTCTRRSVTHSADIVNLRRYERGVGRRRVRRWADLRLRLKSVRLPNQLRTRNWENLSSSIDASTLRKEFWSELKCENFPSTPQTIKKISCLEINVNAINDETTYAYIDEDSNVLDHGNIKESTDSNLTADTDATSEPIADIVESVNFVKGLGFLGTNTINELAAEMGAAILLLLQNSRRVCFRQDFRKSPLIFTITDYGFELTMPRACFESLTGILTFCRKSSRYTRIDVVELIIRTAENHTVLARESSSVEGLDYLLARLDLIVN